MDLTNIIIGLIVCAMILIQSKLHEKIEKSTVTLLKSRIDDLEDFITAELPEIIVPSTEERVNKILNNETWLLRKDYIYQKLDD